MRHFFRGATHVVGLLVVAGAVNAQTKISVDSSRVSPDDPTVLLSELDNPKIVGEFELAEAFEGPMLMLKETAFAWENFRFNLHSNMTCSPTDLFCVPDDSLTAGGTKMPVTPVLPVGVQPPFTLIGPGTQLPYEIRGTSIGHEPANVLLRHTVAEGPIVTAISQKVALDPNTFLVPMNVIVVIPSASFGIPRQRMQPFAREDIFRALFDDVHTYEHLQAPGGVFEAHWNWLVHARQVTKAPATAQHSMVYEMQYDSPSGEWSPYRFTDLGIRPDDVFAQCGIQFRMADFAILDETDGRRVWMTETGTEGGVPFCAGGSQFQIRAILSGFRSDAASQLDDPSLPSLIVTFRLAHPDCLDGNLKGVSDGQSYVAIGIDNNQLDDLTVPHELGHLLGLEHVESSRCTGSQRELMCSGVSGSTHISGCELRNGTPVSPLPRNCVPKAEVSALANCEIARNAAGSMVDATPPLVELGPDLSVECSSAAGATVSITATASDAQSGVSAVLWSPQPSLVSNQNLTASYDLPIATPTIITATVYNGAGLSVTDQITATVTDTQLPVISTVPPQAFNTFNGNQPFSLTAPSVTDTCSPALAATGRVIEASGQALVPPIPVTNGSVSLAAGTYVVEWSATDAAGNVGVATRQTVSVTSCVGAAGSMKLGDRSRIELSNGTAANVVNYGTGFVEVGRYARVGSIVAVGSARLLDHATVDGSIRLGGTLSRIGTASVTGTITENAAVALSPAPTITNPWPSTSQPGFSLEPNKQKTISPGSYGAVSVKSNATLTLSSGTYYFSSLGLEPQSKVRVGSNTVVEVRTSYTQRGEYVSPANVVVPIALRYRGTATAFVESTFLGSALVPNAALTLGGIPGARFEGQFFARDLELRQDVALTVGNVAGVSTLSRLAVAPEFESTDDETPSLSSSGFEIGCNVPNAKGNTPGWSWLVMSLIALRAQRRRARQRNA
jgi:hypothetical protein